MGCYKVTCLLNNFAGKFFGFLTIQSRQVVVMRVCLAPNSVKVSYSCFHTEWLACPQSLMWWPVSGPHPYSFSSSNGALAGSGVGPNLLENPWFGGHEIQRGTPLGAKIHWETIFSEEQAAPQYLPSPCKQSLTQIIASISLQARILKFSWWV